MSTPTNPAPREVRGTIDEFWDRRQQYPSANLRDAIRSAMKQEGNK